MVKISTSNIQRTMRMVEDTWKNAVPDFPFDFSFLDDTINGQYITEQRWERIINYASIMAIAIACLGLFGLTAISVEKRVKEIGIRKVLGASIGNITGLISKELLVLVAMANIIAWPAAYYVLNRLLQGFAYRVTPGILTFFVASVIAVTIALITISFQSVKAGYSNPVNSLKHE